MKRDIVRAKRTRAEAEVLLRDPHLSMTDIARRLGVSRQQVNEWNRRATVRPTRVRRDTLDGWSPTRRAALLRLLAISTLDPSDLAEALEKDGHKVAKNQIVLDRPIKTIGIQDVKIALHPEVSVTVQVNVARSPEEAELQAQGVDVMKDMFEKDVAGFTEERDENLEPGEIATDAPEADAPAEAQTDA